MGAAVGRVNPKSVHLDAELAVQLPLVCDVRDDGSRRDGVAWFLSLDFLEAKINAKSVVHEVKVYPLPPSLLLAPMHDKTLRPLTAKG